MTTPNMLVNPNDAYRKLGGLRGGLHECQSTRKNVKEARVLKASAVQQEENAGAPAMLFSCVAS